MKYPVLSANRHERGDGMAAKLTALPLNINKVVPIIEIVEEGVKGLTPERITMLTEILETLREAKVEMGDAESYVIDAEITIRDFIADDNENTLEFKVEANQKNIEKEN